MYSTRFGYLGGDVIGVVPLCGRQVGTDHGFGHVDGDHQVLHSLPHCLLGSDGDVQAPAGARLEEADALLHVHRNGHETEPDN